MFSIIDKSKKWKNFRVGENHRKDLQFLHYELSQKLKNYNEELINKAFNWAIAAHRNQNRKSGLPYYTHSFEVARIIVNEIPLDDISVAAALLHDVCDNSDYNLADIKLEFGPELAKIIEGIRQIQSFTKYGIKDPDSYRKIIISWFNDIRIIIIALADRLHNMRTIEFLPLEAQKKLAQETMDIYAPFANRFGLGNFKWELEDLAFKVLNPKKYNEIIDKLQIKSDDRIIFIDEFIKPLKDTLDNNQIFAKNNIKFEIVGRPKHIYSIAMKEVLRNKPMDELYDLFAVRIIIDNDNIEYCYTALDVVKQVYPLITGSLKDYVAEPKDNGYQSIHVAVIGMMNTPVEVQIRTAQMHYYAENGLAAHFKYKPGNVSDDSILEQENYEEWIDSVRSIFENHDYEQIKQKNLSTASLNINNVTVLTHTLESKSLPSNSTALDFAYLIHTELGNSCVGAKVNGRIVPLDYILKNGDQIEILNSKDSIPKKQWFKLVKSDKAKYALRNYFNQVERKYLKIGYDKWVNLQKDFKTQLSETEFQYLVKDMKLDNQNEFFVNLGNNSIDINYIDSYLLQKLSLEKNIYIDNRDFKLDLFKNNESMLSLLNKKNAILMECCNPIPGDRIIGEYISGDKMNIHRRSCPKVKDFINPPKENIINLSWQKLGINEYNVVLKIIAKNMDSIISESVNVISKYDKINIKAMQFNTDNNQFIGTVKLSIESMPQYENLLDDINKIQGIIKIERV